MSVYYSKLLEVIVHYSWMLKEKIIFYSTHTLVNLIFLKSLYLTLTCRQATIAPALSPSSRLSLFLFLSTSSSPLLLSLVWVNFVDYEIPWTWTLPKCPQNPSFFASLSLYSDLRQFHCHCWWLRLKHAPRRLGSILA